MNTYKYITDYSQVNKSVTLGLNDWALRHLSFLVFLRQLANVIKAGFPGTKQSGPPPPPPPVFQIISTEPL